LNKARHCLGTGAGWNSPRNRSICRTVTLVELNRMFDFPVYRWLPAKSKIATRFLLFYAKSPDGMTRVDDVSLQNGMLIVEDRASGKTVTLAASRPL
jgi:hypothetical protein